MALRNLTHIPGNIQRVIEILRTLWRHGLGHIVTRLNVQEHLPMVARIVTRGRIELLPTDDETLARRLTLVLQDLGPTFVKLGQILSTRPDLLPEAYVSEFRKLQDKVKPFPTEEARLIIERELRRPLEEVFRGLPDEPAASGSIGQVYLTSLLDGTPVAIKILRPGIRKQIDRDLEILRYLANHAEKSWPELTPLRLVEEFDRAIHKEIDFILEASYTSKFQSFFSSIEGVSCPSIFWEYTTPCMLTMKHMRGISPSNIDELDRLGIDRKQLAKNLGIAFIKQYFELGIFQADPHPGNILIDTQGNIALMDFGMTGHLSDDLLSDLSTALIAMSNQNVEMLIELYADFGDAGVLDRRRLTPDILELFDKYYGMPLKRIDTGNVIDDSLRIARKHNLSLPRDLVMLMRSIVIITKVGEQLDPDFNLVDLIEPEAKRLMLRKLSPRKNLRSFGTHLWQAGRLLRKMPGHLKLILQKIETGTLTVAFKHQGLEKLMMEIDRASNRLSVSIILGSTVVGSSIALHAGILPVRGVSAVGIVGYLVAAILGLWLAWDILRSGRY